jgi:hypothetical protein
MIKNLFNTNQNDWFEHLGGQYNPGVLLGENNIKQMVDNLLVANKLSEKCYSQFLNIELQSIKLGGDLSIEMQLKKALGNAEGKPIILQLCNGSHWITMGLLPNPNNPTEYYVVKMDGKAPDEEVVQSEAEIQEKANEFGVTVEEYKQMLNTDQHQLDPEPVITALKANTLGLTFLTADDDKPFNLSVEGQQYNNSCGLDTALNSVSIIKTYDELLTNNQLNQILNPNSFEQNFKALNSKNVFYQKKDNDKYHILGRETDLVKQEVVRIVGTAVICILAQLIELNQFLNDEINQNLLAKYIKEKNITIEESDFEIKGLNNDLNVNVRKVLEKVLPEQDISLGMINNFIIWLVEKIEKYTSIKWEKSDWFKIINQNTEAKSWAETIKNNISLSGNNLRQ